MIVIKKLFHNICHDILFKIKTDTFKFINSAQTAIRQEFIKYLQGIKSK